MTARVVFAIPGNLEARTGGYLYDKRIADGLRAAGWQVDLLNLGPSFPTPTADDMRTALAGIGAVSQDSVLLIDGLAYGALDTDSLRDVKAPICALVHHPLALESGMDVASAARLKELEKANLALARKVVVTSPHTARTLEREFDVARPRITVALPGTDRLSWPRAPEMPPLIVSVGSLTERKGHDVLLNALALLAEIPWKAEVVGGTHAPAVAERLIDQRRRLGLERRVHFVGELKTGELQAHYARATLFALATRYEGYGMVFAEAVANGLPIVSCASGAVPDTAPRDASILVPPDDPRRFADALRSVLTDQALASRLAAGARAAATTLPRWEEAVWLVGQALTRTAA
jgi:glycosyltransferase involved in cell wall biosynthesis